MDDIDRQSLFNIIFCYFPITFRPPPNDPYGISTDDLRLALRCVKFHLIIFSFNFLIRQSGALTATPTFGPLAIPVFLDKLTAGSRATKVNTCSLCICGILKSITDRHPSGTSC